MLDRSFVFWMSATEKSALSALADYDSTSMSAVLRRLVRTEARRRGLWPPDQHDAQARREVAR